MAGYMGIRIELGKRTFDVMAAMYRDNADAFKKMGLNSLDSYAGKEEATTIFVDENADVKAIEAFISEHKEEYMTKVYGSANLK